MDDDSLRRSSSSSPTTSSPEKPNPANETPVSPSGKRSFSSSQEVEQSISQKKSRSLDDLLESTKNESINIVLNMANQALERSKLVKDIDEKIEYFETMIDRFEMTNKLGVFVLKVAIASEEFARGNLTKCKALVESLKIEAEDIDHSQTCFKFFLLASNYHYSQGEYFDVFKTSIRCCNILISQPCVLSRDEKVTLATLLSMSTLLGDNIFRFNGAFDDRIVQLLKGAQREWISKLLEFMKLGKFAEMETYLQEAEAKAKLPKIVLRHKQEITDKTKIISLVRNLPGLLGEGETTTLSDVGKMMNLAVDEVKSLFVKCHSVGLVASKISGGDGTVTIVLIKEIEEC